jgi:nitroimidazol reductase NimA-like FMN-containing flavoprotein (pyridoxamine 5'-phosphate oxidase superfamily)
VKVVFTTQERRFLKEHDLCRLATCSPKGWPLVTPVAYILIDDAFYVATDYDTTKYKHLKANPKASLVVDTETPNKAVIIQGKVDLIEGGSEFEEVYAVFSKMFSWVRRDPWKPGEAPFLKISPTMKSSWV